MEPDKLKKYVNPGYGMIIFGVIVMAVTAVIAVSMNPVRDPARVKVHIPRWLIIVVGGGFGALFAGVGISFRKDYRKLFGSLSKTELDDLSIEFNSAATWMKDGFRAGTTHIFVKSDPRLIAYDSITDVYERIKTDSKHRETSRYLAVKMQDGLERRICTTEPRGQSAGRIREFYDFVHQKNPSVTFYGR